MEAGDILEGERKIRRPKKRTARRNALFPTENGRKERKEGKTLTIEESVKKDPTGFQEILDARTADIQEALNGLSAKLDGIIGGAIKEYAQKTGAEVNMGGISSYKTMNRLITGKLDVMIREHTREKRKDL